MRVVRVVRVVLLTLVLMLLLNSPDSRGEEATPPGEDFGAGGAARYAGRGFFPSRRRSGATCATPRTGASGASRASGNLRASNRDGCLVRRSRWRHGGQWC